MCAYMCVCGCVLCCFCVAVRAIFDPQARLRGDPLFTTETQREMELSFTKESKKCNATCLERVPAPGGERSGGQCEVKLAVGGHYGRKSVSVQANGLDSTKELPCPQTNSLIEEIVERNEPQWTALFSAIRAAVIKEFKGELNADLSTKSPLYANVKDFLFGGKASWRDFLFTAPEVHIQSVGRRAVEPRRRATGKNPAAGGEAFVALPEHYDGGRGFIVLAISLWTTRFIRMWRADGTVVEMRAEPGHCYLANFVGVRHQVLHAAAGAEAGRGHTNTSHLHDFEVIYFARSAFFRHFACTRPDRLWSGLEARLAACACDAFAKWAPTAKLVLPSLADLERRVELRATKCCKKRRREAEPQNAS